MTSLLLDQLELIALAKKVGFRGKGARIASAIALCEAPAFGMDRPHADPSAIGDQALATNIWGYSYGLWQIRSLRDDKGTGRPRDEDRLPDPLFNARAAYVIKEGSGWGAWSTFSSGMYRAYMQSDYPPVPGTYVVLAGDTLSGIAARLGGFTWQDLARVNGLHEPYSIRIGDTLTLPTVD